MTNDIYQDKKRIIKKLLIVIAISHWPIILLGFLLKFPSILTGKVSWVEILFYVQLALLFSCYLYLVKCKCDSVYFDRSWIRVSFSECTSFILLLVGLLIVSPVVAIVLEKIGFSPVGASIKSAPFQFPRIYMLCGCYLSPIIEELLWRGYVQWNLRKIFGVKTALIGQAAIFALLHFNGGIIYVASAFSNGIILGLWREKRRTLLPLILAHIIVNSIFFSHGLRWLFFCN